MPIEIVELIVRATVEPQSSITTNTATSTPSVSGSSHTDKEAIVAECVEQVIEILKQQKER